MTIVAFVGPSLPDAVRSAFGGVEWRPPAEGGDLLRLADRHPPTICLIDGFFDHRAAVRHKELLLLLSRGSAIYGASSIGALRAAEMRPFGMIGVGAIYRAYADGRIEGDDEVALVHGPSEWDWRPLSLPLVDVRATLHRALRQHVLSFEEARILIAAARHYHYSDRNWEAVTAVLEPPARQVLRAWLPSGQVAQKQLDAVACIAAALRSPLTVPRAPAAVRTCFLNGLARECGVGLAPRFPVPSAAAS